MEADCFVLRSDARKERSEQRELADRMRQRVVLDGFYTFTILGYSSFIY